VKNAPIHDLSVGKPASAFLRLFFILTLAFGSSSTLWSQAIGSIIGTVADPSGAVIAGATVTATNVDNQLSKKVVTGNSGEFTLSNLAVGKYNVTAEATGFTTTHVEGLTLDVSQTRNIDFKLVPGGQSDTAIVTAAPPLINTTDPSLAGLVSEQQVQTLPLNGRSIQNLVMLQPGMAQDNNGSMGWLAPQWIGNGNRGETEVATLDGADSTDEEMGTIQFWNFNLDAIAEFKVQQANYTAEYGRGGGTITQIVTKSGTNQFHGSAFEFIRNGALDASNYFSTTGPAPFQRNEFGVAGGGPILRNKIFFFGQYAGFRQRLGEPTTMNVPTADQRNGLVNVNGYTYQVPLNSVAQGILARYPMPNNPNGIYGVNTFTEQFKQPLNVNQFSVRIDYHLSDKDFLFGRASYINNESSETDAVAAIEDPSFSATQQNNPRNFAISETHLFSPNLINLAMIAVNRQIEANYPPSQAYTQSTFSDGSLSNWGPDTFITKYIETYYDPSDKVTWTKGRHDLNMGIDYRYGQDNGFGVTSAGPNGVYTFNSNTALIADISSTNGGPTITAGSPSPTGLVSMMEGTPITYNRATTLPGFGPTGGGGTHWGLRDWHLATYIQDNVRFTPKLTVNLGLRYEYSSVPYEIRNRLGGIIDQGDLAGHFVLNPNPLYSPQKTNFSPRLGVAYRATDKTVVRGGFAIFTNSIPTVYPDQAAVNLPMASLSILNNPTYSLTPLQVSLPALTSTTGAVMPPGGDTTKIPARTPVDLAPIAAIIGNIAGDWPSDKLKPGYTLTGNVTLEQQIPGDMAMQLSYVTNNSTNLYNTGYPNAYNSPEPQYAPFSAVTPGLGEVQLFYNQGTFHYNALQAQLRKISPLHGLQYQATYTWGKDMTDADAVWSASGTNGAVSLNNPTCIRCEYARASYDVGQRFVANFSYNVPGRWGFVPHILSEGWQTLGIFSAQTGFPFTITEPYGTLQYGYDSLNGAGVRPSLIQKPGVSNHGVPQFLSSDVIQNPGNYFASETTTAANGNTVQVIPGTLGRNTITGPGWWNGDFSMIKNTQLTERVRMEFRSEFFNIFNHSTFNTPTGVIGSGSFGLSTATQSAERQIQFGARFLF
jgi:Carboxypeptidase regulatory-like domain/TonB dependent receptor-like, beta-barrel